MHVYDNNEIALVVYAARATEPAPSWYLRWSPWAWAAWAKRFETRIISTVDRGERFIDARTIMEQTIRAERIRADKIMVAPITDTLKRAREDGRPPLADHTP